jgi:hypothetical protein
MEMGLTQRLTEMGKGKGKVTSLLKAASVV